MDEDSTSTFGGSRISQEDQKVRSENPVVRRAFGAHKRKSLSVRPAAGRALKTLVFASPSELLPFL
jgi:hypothetical protein